jgi:hypothetical protein
MALMTLPVMLGSAAANKKVLNMALMNLPVMLVISSWQ